MESKMIMTIPVLESGDVERDILWYQAQLGFSKVFGDNMYAGIGRENQEIHLQWHADTPEDPVNGGAVVKFFVTDIEPYFNEFLERGTITADRLRKNTPWGTHEFGFFDLNKNAIYIVQDV